MERRPPLMSVIYLSVAATAFVVVSGAVARCGGGSRFSRLSRAVLAAGFAVGTVTHVENLVRLGWIPAPDQPMAFNVFWASLAVLDPVAVTLLFLRPRAGLVLGAAIMVVDLTVNAIAFLRRDVPHWPFAFQAGFALVLALTGARCWREVTLVSDDRGMLK